MKQLKPGYSYVFIDLKDSYLNDKTINIINNTKDIHLYLNHHWSEVLEKQLINIAHMNNYKKIYMYVFNEKEYHFCIENKLTPHLCFVGQDIFNSPLLQYIREDLEIFWFPTSKNISDQHIDKYANYLKKLNLPICISISNIFNSTVNHEIARKWIEQLHNKYQNKLFYKEKELLEIEKYNKNNIYVLQKDDLTTINDFILGIFGDCIIENNNFQRINLKSIIINKQCHNCNHQNYCIDRGLGYIIYTHKYQGCIGIKLFNQS